jgi:plasmid replication initiation protein
MTRTDIDLFNQPADQGYLVDEQGRRWVTQHNALIRASQSLTLSEKRLVALAVSKLDPRKPFLPLQVPTARITAAEYADTYKVDIDTAYDQLKASSKHLYNRSIRFFEPAHRRKGKPLVLSEVNMRWVGRAKYNKGEGWIELAWWPEILPMLTGLKRQFTSYQLEQASALRSIYSWRLLELLERFKSSGVAEYSIEDFCASMDATEKQKADFNNIRRRMIEPAVKELMDKNGWIIQWKPIKAGRKVNALRFEFNKNPQAHLPF